MMVAYEVLDASGEVVRRGEVAEKLLPILRANAQANGHQVRIPTDT